MKENDLSYKEGKVNNLQTNEHGHLYGKGKCNGIDFMIAVFMAIEDFTNMITISTLTLLIF